MKYDKCPKCSATLRMSLYRICCNKCEWHKLGKFEIVEKNQPKTSHTIGLFEDDWYDLKAVIGTLLLIHESEIPSTLDQFFGMAERVEERNELINELT